MSQVTLYYTPSCPYCQRVFSFIKNNNIQLSLKDTASNPANREELRKIGGRTQVPCLVINGKALYESDDIIKWLGTNWKK